MGKIKDPDKYPELRRLLYMLMHEALRIPTGGKITFSTRKAADGYRARLNDMRLALKTIPPKDIPEAMLHLKFYIHEQPDGQWAMTYYHDAPIIYNGDGEIVPESEVLAIAQAEMIKRGAVPRDEHIVPQSEKYINDKLPLDKPLHFPSSYDYKPSSAEEQAIRSERYGDHSKGILGQAEDQ